MYAMLSNFDIVLGLFVDITVYLTLSILLKMYFYWNNNLTQGLNISRLDTVLYSYHKTAIIGGQWSSHRQETSGLGCDISINNFNFLDQ